MSPSTDTRENRQSATEMKFLVSRAVADQVRAWARAELLPDPHATGGAGDSYTITSLYFDTPDFDVFHRRGSFRRSKYRVRRYGESEVAFLERKLKTGGMLTKRRSVIPLGETDKLVTVEPTRGWPGFWFHRRLLARQLRPVCQISYQRTARVAPTPHGPIRLTLDDGLHASPAIGLEFANEPGIGLLSDHLILELKFRFDLPARFKCLVEEFALTPRAFSKYRCAVAALGLATSGEIMNLEIGERIPPNETSRFEPLNAGRFLSRPAATLSFIRNEGEGRGEEVSRFTSRTASVPGAMLGECL